MDTYVESKSLSYVPDKSFTVQGVRYTGDIAVYRNEVKVTQGTRNSSANTNEVDHPPRARAPRQRNIC